MFVPVMGRQMLDEVRLDIGSTTTPTWLKASPANLGDPSQGKLSSKEWRTVFTVGFLLTLVRLWGCQYKGTPQTGQEEALDNFLHLVICVSLATQEEMNPTIISLYTLHINAYLEGFKILYPTNSIIPYHHLALHLPRFLQLFGPWASWNTGPYETYNGMLQRILTNSHFGESPTLSRRHHLTKIVLCT